LQVLPLLPNDWSFATIEAFLRQALQRDMEHNARVLVTKGLVRSLRLQQQELRTCLQKQRSKLLADALCMNCGKRLVTRDKCLPIVR
jgi:hypothetical protein